MSRSGRIPIPIPENTDVKLESGIIFAKGNLVNYLLNSIKMLK